MRNLAVLFACALFFITDIIFDIRQGIPLSHVWHEAFLLILALCSIVWQLIVIFDQNKYIVLLSSELLETKNSYLDWKTRTHTNAQEIRQLIDDQFSLWQLSQSEKDVALFLIKGLAMKEIADIRSTHEKTVRQQATNIYKKSGLSGRQELAAFFSGRYFECTNSVLMMSWHSFGLFFILTFIKLTAR